MKLLLFSITAAAALAGSAVTAEAGPRHSSGFHIENYVNPSVRPAHNGHRSHSHHSHRSHLHKSHSRSGHAHGSHHGSAHLHRGHHGHHGHIHSGHHVTPYKVSTVEVHRCTEPRIAYHPGGRRYTYYVTVVTYRDHYSNGTTRTWTQTFS